MFRDPTTARVHFCPPNIGLFRGVGGVSEICFWSERRCTDGSTSIFIPHFMEYNRPAQEYNHPLRNITARLTHHYQNPRRACPRVLKLCMGSLLTKII